MGRVCGSIEAIVASDMVSDHRSHEGKFVGPPKSVIGQIAAGSSEFKISC